MMLIGRLTWIQGHSSHFDFYIVWSKGGLINIIDHFGDAYILDDKCLHDENFEVEIEAFSHSDSREMIQ